MVRKSGSRWWHRSGTDGTVFFGFLEQVQVHEDEEYQVQEKKYRHEPEEPFGGLVVEDHHTPERPQRAEERCGEESSLGDAPVVLFCQAFVEAKEQKYYGVAGEPDGENNC